MPKDIGYMNCSKKSFWHLRWISKCRCSDLAVWHQLVKCCVSLILDGWCKGLYWFWLRGRTSSRVCEGTILTCTGVPVVGGYKRGESGREAPKSLLEWLRQVPISRRVGECVFCELCASRWTCPEKEPASSFYRHKEGRLHAWDDLRSCCLLPEWWENSRWSL